MNTFERYFPAAKTMYSIFVALAIGLILLNWIWQLFKNYGLSAGIEAEDPVKLSIRSVIFILLAYFADEIVNMILKIGGTPYNWILNSELPSLDFANFNSVILTILGVCASGTVSLIALILILILLGTISNCCLKLQNGMFCLVCLFTRLPLPLRWALLKQPPTYLKAGAECLAVKCSYF